MSGNWLGGLMLLPSGRPVCDLLVLLAPFVPRQKLQAMWVGTGSWWDHRGSKAPEMRFCTPCQPGGGLTQGGPLAPLAWRVHPVAESLLGFSDVSIQSLSLRCSEADHSAPSSLAGAMAIYIFVYFSFLLRAGKVSVLLGN